jgi:two-component system, LytTR family, response regulator
MSIRTLLIDDEEIARRGLRIRLERVFDIDIVGECANAREALQAIKELSPDLLFLDIQMPEISGFELIGYLPVPAPYIVFVTAYSDHAVRAFEVHALDYLLKPIDDGRLADCLRRVRAATGGGKSGEYARRTAQMLASEIPTGLLGMPRVGAGRLAIPSGDRLMLVRAPDIDWVQASGNYVAVHIGKKSYLLRDTMSAMDQRLAPYGFARIHRSTLVNIHRVSELRSLENGEFDVLLRDGITLKLSRGYRNALDQLIGSRL